MTVRWSHTAYECLGEIEAFVALDDPAAAVRLTDRLIERTKPLADQSRMGREIPELPGAGLLELVEGNYRIMYGVGRGEVAVLVVIEGHRLLPADLLHQALPEDGPPG